MNWSILPLLKGYASHNFYNGSSQNKLKKKHKQNILDKIHLIGDDKGGLYLFDRDIQQPNKGIK
jgi:ferritin